MGLFGGNNMTGFNPTEVEAMSSKIQQAANSVSETIVSKLKSGVVSPISKAWYTEEGVKFFQAFAESVKQTGTSIEEIFNSFVTSVENAGNNWAENAQQTERVSLTRVSGIDLNLDVSEVQNNKGGDVGIIEADATAVANGLPGVRQEIESELSRIANNLSAESAFLGHSQAEAVTACFKKVNVIVSKVFDFLIEGENNLQSQIKKAVEKYGDVGSQTASAFNDAA